MTQTTFDLVAQWRSTLKAIPRHQRWDLRKKEMGILQHSVFIWWCNLPDSKKKDLDLIVETIDQARNASNLRFLLQLSCGNEK